MKPEDAAESLKTLGNGPIISKKDYLLRLRLFEVMTKDTETGAGFIKSDFTFYDTLISSLKAYPLEKTTKMELVRGIAILLVGVSAYYLLIHFVVELWRFLDDKIGIIGGIIMLPILLLCVPPAYIIMQKTGVMVRDPAGQFHDVIEKWKFICTWHSGSNDEMKKRGSI